ncbi:MAG: O-antigen ligase family protein [Marinobacterium sp.]|nr:O-antigen ligase family protein [Marinobacterium sp.]
MHRVNKPGKIAVIVSSLLVVALVLTPLSDFASVAARFNGAGAVGRISLLFRFFVLGMCIFLMVQALNARQIIMWLIFIFCTLNIWVNVLFFDAATVVYGVETSLFMLKYFLFFIYYLAFLFVLNSSLVSYESFKKIFDFLIIFYSVPVILGGIFMIKMFFYYSTERWGVKGIVYAGNELSGLLLVSLTWAYLDFRYEGKKLILIIVSMATIICGTKAALLSFILMVIGYLFSRGGFTSYLYMVVAIVMGTFAVMGAYLYVDSIQKAVDNSMAYFIWQFENNADGSLLTLLLSGRDQKFDVVYTVLQDSFPWVFVLGGYPVSTYTVEMDLFDLIALLGIFGTIIYMIAWFRCWIYPKKGDQFMGRIKIAFIAVYLFLAFTAGHMFYSAVLAPFLAMLSIRMQVMTGNLTFDSKE